MEKTEFVLRGGGTHASVVIDAIQSGGHVVSGIFDPALTPTNKIGAHTVQSIRQGISIFPNYSAELLPKSKAIIAIGDNMIRWKLASETLHVLGVVKDCSAIVSAHSTIGGGTMILQGVIIQTYASIGKHVIVNTGAKIDHDVVIGDFAHIGPGAILCGLVSVGEGTLIGAGAIILPGVSVGKWAVVGAGAVITENINDCAVVVGNPARYVKENTKHP